MGTERAGNSQSPKVLQTREQLHEALFEYNPSQTIVVDNEGRIITYNKAKRESGDRLPNEGDIIFRDYAGKYDIDMYSELAECIATGETRVYAAQRYADKVLCTTIAPFPGGAIVITEDVTDDKNAEEFNKALFEYNPSQTIVVDEEGRIITYNKAKRDSGDRLPGSGDVMFKDYAGKYDIDMFSELCECIRTGETKVFAEQNYVDKVLCTTIAPFPGGAIIITEDITEDKKTEQFNKALFEYNPSQTIVVDEEGKIITCNKAKRESGDRLPGSGDVMFKDYAGRYDIDMFSELTKCIRTGERGQFGEQKYVDKILSTTISPFPGGAIVITEDVTSKVEAEKELTKANEELKERDRLQTTFVSNISHELRTALCIFRNTMSNMAAGSKGKLDKKLAENLRMADDSVGRLWQVIDDFVELSEIETGNVQLSCSRFDLGEVIRSVVDSMTPRAKSKKIKLKIAAKKDGLSVIADGDKIRHVLKHLVDNGIKFVPEGGKVEICAQDSDDEVRVTVKDNGLGIESDKIEKIFDCFTKYGAAHSGSMAGVGLGLTLAKGLIEMHGGRIWAESTVGEGSTFHFTLPKQS